MKTRNAKRLALEISSEQFEEALEKYTLAERREAEINKTIEGEVNELVEKYEDERQCLAQGKTAAFDTIQSYCLNNKEVLFGKRRSIGSPYGTVGFRLGTPRLKTIKGSDWNQVLDGLKES